MGGVGKTALALKLAEELSPLYPDGGIFLDLKGVADEGQKPLTASQAMAHVIRAFHPEAWLPEDEAEISGHYQSVLHGRRVLLLMDNSASAPQVAPLSPPKGCLLLVTSRFHFTLPGSVTTNLGKFPHNDACAFLLKIAPRIGGTASDIAHLCDGLPFALRLAGGSLTERTDLIPDSYLRHLADERERLDFIEGTLKLSVQLLSKELKGLWCKLAVFPASFDAVAAAEVWRLEPDLALNYLGRLVKSSLIDGKDGRYHLHDLTRLFANSHLSEADRKESQAAHAEHYLLVVAAAAALYKEGGDALRAGLRLFDSEWANIQASQRWASSLASQEKRAAELTRDFPDRGASILALRLSPREQISWLEVALDSSRGLKDRSGEGSALGSLGLAYAALGECRRAIEFHDQHLTISREIGNRRDEGNALGNLGLAYAALGEPLRAIKFHDQHLTIAREIGDRRGEGTGLGSLGLAYAALGQPHRAIELYKQRLAIARDIGDRRSEGNALGSLGLVYADLGKLRRALKSYKQHLVIAREIGDRRGEGTALGNMGNVYADLGAPRRAIDSYNQHLAIAREIGDRRGEGNALGNIGKIYADRGEFRDSIEYFEQHLAIARAIGDRRGEGIALSNMGNAYADLGKPQRAIKFYTQRLTIARAIGDRRGEAQATWDLGLAFEHQGEIAYAAQLMQTLVDYQREIGHPDTETHAARVEEIRARVRATEVSQG